MQNIAIMPNLDKDKQLVNTKRVFQIIKKYKKNVLITEKIAKLIGYDGEVSTQSDIFNNSDLVIVLGGDGTLLNVARHTAINSIPVVGINLGHLGFLVELEKDELDIFFEKIFNGDYIIETRLMVEGSLIRGGMTMDTFIALNDIGITRGAFSRIITLKVSIDEEYLDSYPADGIIVSTPTGSTGYSLSAGGPIVDPNMDLLMVTPVCPHTLQSRSIVVAEDKTIYISVENPYYHDAVITVDGQQGYKIQPDDMVVIKKSIYRAHLLRVTHRSFYNILRQKLAERGGHR